MPAHVGAPLTLGAVVAGGSGLAAHWLGLPAMGVVAVVLAVTIVAALAAHRTVSSLAVGAGLLLAQPYLPGDRVRVYVPTVGQTVDAEVVRVGAANTTLLVRAGDGIHGGAIDGGVDSLVVLPNNRVLRPGAD